MEDNVPKVNIPKPLSRYGVAYWSDHSQGFREEKFDADPINNVQATRSDELRYDNATRYGRWCTQV